MELGLPISPLCDRSVTLIPESQLGENLKRLNIAHAVPNFIIKESSQLLF